MPTTALEARLRQQLGVAIIDLRGEIDISAEPVLDAAYAEAEGRDPDAVLLNFGQVTYINSKGIALIVGLLARARQAGRRMLAYGLNDHFTEIFQITRLSDLIALYADEASALAGAFQAPEPVPALPR